MSRKSLAPLALGLSLSVALVVGCSPAVHNITIRSAVDAVAPEPGTAAIVIMQPRSVLETVSILGADGGLLGMIHGHSRTVVRVAPGTVRLYCLPMRNAGAGDRVEGTVEAGRIYYVTLSYTGWSDHVSFLALNTRSRDERWTHLAEYISGTPLVEMDQARVPLVLRELGDRSRYLAEIDRWADRLDADHREERTIQPGDGQ